MSRYALTEQSPNLIEILQARAVEQPDSVAYQFLVDGEQAIVALTYAELEQRARAIASKLSVLCSPGARVLLVYPPGLDYIAALFGCWMAGAIAVPTYPPQPNRSFERLRTLLSDCQPRLILSDQTTCDRLLRLQLTAVPWLPTDSLLHSPPPPPPPLPAPSTASPALLQYTSGSTATPKGVVITHQNLIANLRTIQQQFGHTPQSKGVIWLPPYHDMGLVGGILQPLFVGFPVLLFSPWLFMQQPLRWLRAISHHAATTSGAPNFAYDLCVRKLSPKAAADLDLSSWQVAFNGAEPVQAATLERFAATFAPYGFRPEAFYPCYGMAEATLMISGSQRQTRPVYSVVDGRSLQQHQVVPVAATAPNAKTLVACGLPLPNQEILIVDPETRSPLPTHQVGEIWVSAAQVAAGYWNRPTETQETFRATLASDPTRSFLRTGDLGFWQNNHLFITGRLKELIVIRGRNHYPQDIELTVQDSHPALLSGQGAVFEIEQDGAPQIVVVQEVERPLARILQASLETSADSLEAEEIFRAIVQAVAIQHDLQVGAIALLKPGELPKTPSGKIQRRGCRTLFLAGQLGAIAQWNTVPQPPSEPTLTPSPSPAPAPRTEVEIQDWLVVNLANYLKVAPDKIDTTAPFAYYGLDSSVAVSLTGELAEWLGVEALEPTLFWEYPSIEGLSQHLGQ